MSQTTSLSEIVRLVPDHVEAKGNWEKIVVINADNGQIAGAIGFFDGLITTYRHYLVTNSLNQQKVLIGHKSVKYKQGNEEVVFLIDYKGTCLRGREAQVAHYYHRTTEPDNAIADSLGKWLIEYFSSDGRTIYQFYSQQQQAASTLVTRSATEFGLDLTITLKVEKEVQLEPIDIGPLTLSSRLLGSDEEEKISIKAELEVDPQERLRAMLNQKTSLTDLFKKGVKQYLAGHVRLQTYYDDLNSEQVKRGLRDHLNNLLKQFGRRVAFISLKPEIGTGANPSSSQPAPYSGETIVEHKHHETPDPIKIKISVLMIPKDATRYRAKGSPPLGPWLQHNLDEVIRMVLFGVSFVDFLLNFSALKLVINEEMNRRAEAIGYKIEQLMTMLCMEQFTWVKRIDIEIKGTANNSDDAMFETSVSGVYVGLEIFLTARVKDLRGVTRYLTTHLPAKMREEIIRLVQKTMHATDPQEFYKPYNQNFAKKYSTGGPFENDLRSKIAYLLESDFNSEVIHLVLKQTDTDLTHKLYQVARISHDFTATSEIGTTPGAPKITVHGSFTVEAVSHNGWERFQERDVSAEQLIKRVADSVGAFIKCTPDENAALTSQRSMFELIDRALQSAHDLIDEEFGLSIKLTTISWDWEDRLIEIGRRRNDEDLEAVQERIAKLKDRLLDHYEYNASQEAIDETRASIARLSAMVPASLVSSVGFKELPEPPAVKSLPAADVDA